jgi:hypothetical protein
MKEQKRGNWQKYQENGKTASIPDMSEERSVMQPTEQNLSEALSMESSSNMPDNANIKATETTDMSTEIRLFKPVFYAMLDYKIGRISFLEMLTQWKQLLGIEKPFPSNWQ